VVSKGCIEYIYSSKSNAMQVMYEIGRKVGSSHVEPTDSLLEGMHDLPCIYS
jgi:hypothetical protein